MRFRLWNNSKKCFMHSYSPFMFHEYNLDPAGSKDELILLLSTQYKDANDIEIFEEDIIGGGLGDIVGVVKYDPSLARFVVMTILPGGTQKLMNFSDVMKHPVVVIGNSFENGDLL